MRCAQLESDLFPVTTKADDPRYFGVLRWTLYVIAILSFAWTVYRAFLNVEIENNEGWNAYFADAAMGKMPLYPSADQLITNNYPPLSFYIVGLAGRFIGDPVLAGRLLSLVAVVGCANDIAVRGMRGGGGLPLHRRTARGASPGRGRGRAADDLGRGSRGPGTPAGRARRL